MESNYETKRCFRCKKLRTLDKFKVNRMRHKIASDKGRCIVCVKCDRVRVLSELWATRFDFEQRQFVVHRFKNKNQALNFLKTDK